MNTLLSADLSRLGRPDVPPSSDAVDEKRVGGTPEELKTDRTSWLGVAEWTLRRYPCATTFTL
jgi:hypothetical protein